MEAGGGKIITCNMGERFCVIVFEKTFLGRRIEICTPAVGLFYKRCPLYAPRERQEWTIVLT